MTRADDDDDDEGPVDSYQAEHDRARPSYDDDEPTEVRPCPALPPRKQLAEGVQ